MTTAISEAQRKVNEINAKTDKVRQQMGIAKDPLIQAAQLRNAQAIADQKTLQTQQKLSHLSSIDGQRNYQDRQREILMLAKKERVLKDIALNGRLGAGLRIAGEGLNSIGLAAGLSTAGMTMMGGQASPTAMATLTGSWNYFSAQAGSAFIPAMAQMSKLLQSIGRGVEAIPRPLREAAGSTLFWAGTLATVSFAATKLLGVFGTLRTTIAGMSALSMATVGRGVVAGAAGQAAASAGMSAAGQVAATAAGAAGVAAATAAARSAVSSNAANSIGTQLATQLAINQAFNAAANRARTSGPAPASTPSVPQSRVARGLGNAASQFSGGMVIAGDEAWELADAIGIHWLQRKLGFGQGANPNNRPPSQSADGGMMTSSNFQPQMWDSGSDQLYNMILMQTQRGELDQATLNLQMRNNLLFEQIAANTAAAAANSTPAPI